MTKKQKKMLVRILITAVMLIALKFIPITGIPQLLAYVAAYVPYSLFGCQKRSAGRLEYMRQSELPVNNHRIKAWNYAIWHSESRIF